MILAALPLFCSRRRFLPAAAQERFPKGTVQTIADADGTCRAKPNVHPFAAMAGTWTGGGTIDLTNDIHEKLRCRATYTYGAGNNGLALAIRCASDNYKFELTSNVVERNGQISGRWNETAYKRLRLDQRARQRRPHLGGCERRQLHRGPVGEHQRQPAIGHHHAAGHLHRQRADRHEPGGGAGGDREALRA